jgi:polyhydroxyalkanoate synthesis regulator phasin
MKLRLALEEKLMDARLRDRLLAEGKITKEQVKKYLDSLTDEAKNAVPLVPEEVKNLQ